ncbi:MAG: carboxypeptidase regulatory-like domain-containing protein [Candidatus Kapabacteria bacterium]|nr:carboxypeptidase regulatory-like domain-containing protein [Candidatus Kapabacteria bacterium]
MRKILLLIILLSFIIPYSLSAGIYGTIKGKVTDAEGNPMIGASVVLEGTRLGAIVKGDGTFTILNVNPGTYNIKISYTGYLTFEKRISVSADIVTEVNAVMRMKEEGVTTKEIEVIAKKMVENTAVGSNRMVSSQDLTTVAREGVTAIIGLSAGVFNSGNGFNIRGSRETETQIRVDGLDVGNQFTGGFGASGLSYFPMVSSFAVEEVQVLTGGFSAEYGDALGGIVNTVVRTGRTDRYDGFIRWRTDVDPLWGRQNEKLKLIREGNRYKAINDGPGYKLQGPGQHKFEFGTGGPIPILDKSTYYLTGSYQFEKHLSNSYEIYDPDGNNVGLQPDNRSWVKNLTGRLKFAFIENIDFIVGGSFGMTNYESSGWGWRYANTPGQAVDPKYYNNGLVPSSYNPVGIPERVAKQPVVNNLILNAMVRITHRLSQNSFYEFTISNTSNNDETSKRQSFEDPGFFTGFDLWYPQDNVKVQTGGVLDMGKDKVIDQFTPLTKIQFSKDGYLKADFPIVHPMTGYIEGASSAQGSNNAYGLVGYFVEHGNNRAFEFRKGNYWQIDGNYNLFLTGQFQHMFKAGFEMRLYQIRRHENSLPWDANPFFDVYTDEWGGNLYADNQVVFDKTSKPYKPLRLSAYVQDQITYKGIIISPGLRFDFFNPNSDYRLPSRNFVSITADTGFAKADPKLQISPRINVTYPITDRSNITLAYGLFFKMPEMQYMYDGFGIAQLRGNQNLGDPNMDAQRSNQYMIAYNNQLTDDFAFDVSAYYKDIYNQVGMRYVATTPQPFYQYAVSEYGNARGLEFTLRKRPTDHFGFSINYTLSSASGTSSGPGDNYLRPTDPYTGLQAFPLSDFPLSFDRRHRINLIFNLVWGQDEGPSIAGIDLLENTNINLSGFFQTGTPYTRLDRAGNPIGEYNAERQPSRWSVDLRFSRTFYLRDWFGSGAGSTAIEFFFDITNLFNNTQVASYFARTGDPDDDGVNFYRPVTDFGSTPYYKEASFGRSESIASDQYDLYGNRFYSEKSDFDKNGIVTQEEKFLAFSRYLEDVRKFRGNYQAPRQVWLGFMFRF